MTDDEMEHISVAANALMDKLAVRRDYMGFTPSTEASAKIAQTSGSVTFPVPRSARDQIADMTRRLDDMEKQLQRPMIQEERYAVASDFIKLYDEREIAIHDYYEYLRDIREDGERG